MGCEAALLGARDQESSPSVANDASMAAMIESLNAVISEAEVQALMVAIAAPLNVASLFNDKNPLHAGMGVLSRVARG